MDKIVSTTQFGNGGCGAVSSPIEGPPWSYYPTVVQRRRVAKRCTPRILNLRCSDYLPSDNIWPANEIPRTSEVSESTPSVLWHRSSSTAICLSTYVSWWLTFSPQKYCTVTTSSRRFHGRYSRFRMAIDFEMLVPLSKGRQGQARLVCRRAQIRGRYRTHAYRLLAVGYEFRSIVQTGSHKASRGNMRSTSSI